jgi:hypothetical protein
MRHKFPSLYDFFYLSHTLSSHSLSLFVVSLSSPKPAGDSSPTAEKCIEGGGHASSPLVRRLSRYIDYIESSPMTKQPYTSRISTVDILQCRFVLKSPSIPIFYS